MGKKLCKLRLDEKVKKGKKPKYQCKSCGRLASKDKHLCKPKAL